MSDLALNSLVVNGTSYLLRDKIGRQKIALNLQYIEQLQIDINTKVDKETNKGLSTNDFTNELFYKLLSLENYDDKDIVQAQSELKNRVDEIQGNGENSITHIASELINEAINKFASEISDDGTINTFKELVDWAAEHGPQIEQIIKDINSNRKDIDSINGLIPTFALKTEIPVNVTDLLDNENYVLHSFLESQLSNYLLKADFDKYVFNYLKTYSYVTMGMMQTYFNDSIVSFFQEELSNYVTADTFKNVIENVFNSINTNAGNILTNKIAIEQLNNSKVSRIYMDEEHTREKVLSENDFTDTYKNKLDDLKNYNDTIVKADIETLKSDIESLNEITSNINSTKVDKVEGKQLSSNDFTDEFIEKIETNRQLIDILNGEETISGSVLNSIKKAINEFANTITDDGVVDTFKEMIDYVAEHQSDYASLAELVKSTQNDFGSRIKNLENNKFDKADFPTNVSAFTNDLNYVQKDELSNYYNKIEVDNKDATLDKKIDSEILIRTNLGINLENYKSVTNETLNNHSDRIGVLEVHATSVDNILPSKVNKQYVDFEKTREKVLSENDFTDVYKDKLDYLIKNNINDLSLENSQRLDVVQGDEETEGSILFFIKKAIDDFTTVLTDDGSINTFKEIVEYVKENQENYLNFLGEHQKLRDEYDKFINVIFPAYKQFVNDTYVTMDYWSKDRKQLLASFAKKSEVITEIKVNEDPIEIQESISNELNSDGVYETVYKRSVNIDLTDYTLKNEVRDQLDIQNNETIRSVKAEESLITGKTLSNWNGKWNINTITPLETTVQWLIDNYDNEKYIKQGYYSDPTDNTVALTRIPLINIEYENYKIIRFCKDIHSDEESRLVRIYYYRDDDESLIDTTNISINNSITVFIPSDDESSNIEYVGNIKEGTWNAGNVNTPVLNTNEAIINSEKVSDLTINSDSFILNNIRYTITSDETEDLIDWHTYLDEITDVVESEIENDQIEDGMKSSE